MTWSADNFLKRSLLAKYMVISLVNEDVTAGMAAAQLHHDRLKIVDPTYNSKIL